MLTVHDGGGGDAQGVAWPRRTVSLAERASFAGLQIGGAEEVGDLAGMSRVAGSSGAGVSSSAAA
ncbi:hypothetical protein GCM10010350_75720 [Streptomyces galilaeus]|nr:hypothetical protein GCM10010350_75720 [Streptomyces galilaeus]